MLTKEKEKELISLYLNGATTKELCIKYGWSLKNRNGPLNILKKYNILIRKDNETCAQKYTIKSNYFEVIDSKDKAYFLGLLWADGSIDKDKNTVSLGLVKKDVYILEIFKKYLNSNKPLRNYKTAENKQEFYSLIIEDRKIKQDLIKLGLICKKSILQTNFPKINPEFNSHFIRGYFDGDGSATYNKSKVGYIAPVVNFTGTENFIKELQSVLIDDLKLNKENKFQKRYKHKEHSSGTISYGGKNLCKLIYDYLYKDSDDLFFIRKKTKLIALIKGDFNLEAS